MIFDCSVDHLETSSYLAYLRHAGQQITNQIPSLVPTLNCQASTQYKIQVEHHISLERVSS